MNSAKRVALQGLQCLKTASASESAWIRKRFIAQSICKRVITLLSAKKVVTKDLEGLLHKLRAMRVNTVVRATYVEHVHEFVADICEQAADVIEAEVVK